MKQGAFLFEREHWSFDLSIAVHTVTNEPRT